MKITRSVCDRYEEEHGEIFNPIEQDRLHWQLKQAIARIETPSLNKVALDYGCGSGNLTRHLINMGLAVVAADVSNSCLAHVKRLYNSTGLLDELVKTNGKNLFAFESNCFDLVAVYSVLHHIPDYLALVEEIARVTKPGGIIYIDHEASSFFWERHEEFLKLFKATIPPPPPKNWTKYLKPFNYIKRINAFINPRYWPEGDIHVWPDDHIEWDKIEAALIARGCEVISSEDYLLYRRGYSEVLYDDYKRKGYRDMKVSIVRKT